MEAAKQVISATETVPDDGHQRVPNAAPKNLATISLRMPADSELNLNKKKMIRKMKKERHTMHLTAMIKTIKKRSDSDMVNEAKQELEEINRRVEAMPVEEVGDMVNDTKAYPVLEIPLPRRFNPEKFREWDLELLQSMPPKELDNSRQLSGTGLRLSKQSRSTFARFIEAN